MENFFGNNALKVNEQVEDEYKKNKSNINLEMLIKSLYILKNVFSFINNKKKYEIIIYNKKLQEKLQINIDNYKKLSGKRKEGEKNGIGKVYKKYIN